MNLRVSSSTDKKRFADQLRITEIFYSLQGETRFVGLPTVFIRLTGCPLRCGYCDSAYAFSGGDIFSLADILSQVQQYQTRYVTVTGGEPLAQPGAISLLKQLCDLDYCVSLETSGALDISPVDSRVARIVDVKTPGSGEVARFLPSNLAALTEHDALKFVVVDEADYQWAKEFIANNHFPKDLSVLFSPVYETLAPSTLADWILRDQLPVRLQVQLHKVLWGDVPGR